MSILRMEVQSYVGAGVVILFASFCVSILLIAMKNFDSDVNILTADQPHIRTIPPSQRVLMDAWIQDNNIQIPEGEGYRWLLKTYPSRPWEK